MCGICGYVSRNRITDNELSIMNDTMKHRGPDDNGLVQIQRAGFHIGLAQRRLAILDLSDMGHQPMYSNNKNYVIVYNGEIYNFHEVREKLKSKGKVFHSNCDTEVILAAYELCGKECVKQFNGMFAFAIFDFNNQILFMARDRIGKKPFYYYYDKCNEMFVFASTLQPILKFPSFTKRINKSALYNYFYYGYICEPFSIFENVYKLEPGSTAELRLENFELEHNKYWDLYSAYNRGTVKSIDDYDEAKENLKACIVDAVNKRMISDVPLGTFLSGGIDSTLVTAIAQSISSRQINTYSIGFYEKKYDESVYAKEISNHIGTNHHSFMVSEEDMISLADDLPKYYDEPFSDSSQLPSMLVSKMAKQEITVALTGDGGDELFCGYEGYDDILRVSNYKKLAKYFYPLSKLKIIQDRIPTRILSILNEANDDTCQWTSVALKKLVDSIFDSDKNDVRYDESWLDKNINIQSRRMLMDMITYLPGDILHKVDRASMKYSLESRCPLLDHNVVETSFRIPHKYKYCNGEKKFILKDLTYEYVPRELLNRPKKGFSVPLKKILDTKKAQELLKTYSTEDFLKNQGLFKYEGINALNNIVFDDGTKYSRSYINNAVRVLWNYYVFQLWYSCYMVN